MRRRDFINGIVGSAALPLAAHAQQPTMPVIGFLSGGSPNNFAKYVDAFRQGLSEADYIVHRNVSIEYRWAEGEYDRLPRLAKELVIAKVDVIAATGGYAPAKAAQAATKSIPIVFTGGGDPVTAGLVASLSHPGGNATGVTNFSTILEAKRLESPARTGAKRRQDRLSKESQKCERRFPMERGSGSGPHRWLAAISHKCRQR